MKVQLKIQWFNFRFVFFCYQSEKKLAVSYMILLLKTKISPLNHIFRDNLDKFFQKESI